MARKRKTEISNNKVKLILTDKAMKITALSSILRFVIGKVGRSVTLKEKKERITMNG